MGRSIAKQAGPSTVLSLTRQGWWACFLVLVGFGVRIFGLTYHSLWLDEAVSVYLASFPPAEIFRQGMSLQEPNPPVYHLSLYLWMRVFGSGEAGVRILSALLGALYLPAIYLLGRRLLSSRGALIATLLAAINPFLVWYSQEARMYALVALLSAWSLYCFVRALDTPRWFWWTAYGILTVAGLYTHLYAVFLLPAQFLYLVLYARWHREAVWQGMVAWTASLLCFLPWLWRAWELSASTPSWRPSLGLGGMLLECLEAFTLRRVPLTGVARASALLLLGAMVIVGLLVPRVPRRGFSRRVWAGEEIRPSVFLILTLLVPFTCAYLLSFRQQIFTVYYLIVIVAPFILALASGVDKVASFHRGAGLLSLVVAVGLLSYGLGHNWSLEYRKEEWRAAARYVAANAGPGDAVLCHADYTRIPFTYYYRGDLPVLAPFGGPVGGKDDVARMLEGLEGYYTVWLMQSHTDWVDPNRTVEGWLAESYPVVTEQYPPGVEVKGYATKYRLDSVPSSADTIDAVFDGGVRLAAFEIHDGPHEAADDTYHPPSGWIHVTLYWRTEDRLAEDYVATVRLVDAGHGVWGGSLERATNAMRFHPPSSWQVGEIVRDDYDVNLNPRTPQGSYALEVSLLTPSGEPLEVIHEGERGDAVPLGQVVIVSP